MGIVDSAISLNSLKRFDEILANWYLQLEREKIITYMKYSLP